MTPKERQIAIIYKRGKYLAKEIGHEMKLWLEEKGIKVNLRQNIDESERSKREKALIQIAPETEAVVVLGGDGTLLSVARLLSNSTIPVVGINIGGGMGFMTEVCMEARYEVLERILRKNYEIEERIRLVAEVKRENECIFQQTVLNDAVINKAALARIINLRVSIDNDYLTTYKGDGLIIATPTGSTAYNISAGGPIVYPTAQVFLLTPICSFTLSNRPIILLDSMEVEVELEEKAGEVTLTCDGQVGLRLMSNDVVIVRKAPVPLNLIRTPFNNYFDILRSKLKWGQN